MRTAVLAWGSLVWAPRNRYGELVMAGDWQEDGPRLPIEFARISSDRRLTLVIVPGYPHLTRTHWTVSAFEDLDAARANLARRETNAPIGRIHGVGPDGPLGDPAAATVEAVGGWLAERPYLDAAVWTGLGPGPRWGAEGWSLDAAVAHVAGLVGEERDRALEYVRNAPRSVDTPVRRALQRLLYPSR